MAKTETTGSRIMAICTCVPSERFDNLKDAKEFTQEEIRKVTAMAGISARRVADDFTTSGDLCEVAANRVLEMTGWERDSIDALIMVTQSPDYFTPSTACVLQKRLNLSEQCAAFDVGLGMFRVPVRALVGEHDAAEQRDEEGAPPARRNPCAFCRQRGSVRFVALRRRGVRNGIGNFGSFG